MNRWKSGSLPAIWMVSALVAVAGAGGAWLVWERCGLRGCPDVDQLNGYRPDEGSVVVDRAGRELAKLKRVHRIVVSLDSLPEHVGAAFVAVEDQRFWEHGGVDWTRVVGAALVNLRSLSIREGFSTITMQLARNLFPERLPQSERTLSRKLAEMRVAVAIEDRFTKRQILELYLNQIYFGDGAYGIEAAAQEYFGTSAAALTLAEAALLAGIIRAPSRLNPRQHPERALARRHVVLARMAEQGWITPAAAAETAAAPLELSRGESRGVELAAYYVEEVRRLLERELGGALYTGGYTIHTTLDAGVQAVAESELEAQLRALEAGRHGTFRHPIFEPPAADLRGDGRTSYVQGAVVVMEAATGSVLAMVGGRDFGASKFNRATQARRQPGSAFKPFVYATALAMGVPATEILSDAPLRRVLDDGTVWEPRNFEGGYGGAVTLRDALVRSRNVATVRLADAVGIERVVETAERLGLGPRIPRVPSVAIGAAEVTLLDMVAAYAAFATLGLRPEPRLVTRVVDREGRVVWRSPPRIRRVLDPAVAFLLTDILRDAVDRGTGTAVRAVGYRGPAAGKTGTTNDATDVWFLGYTPARVAGVWIGFDRPQPIVGGATGGRIAAPVWGRIMRRIGGGGADWAPPPGIETRWIDGAGRIIGPGCPAAGPVRAEYFLAGTVPDRGCGGGLAYPWLDTLLGPGPDSLAGRPADSADGDWWRRYRRGWPGRPEGVPAPPDTGLPPFPPDTLLPAEPASPSGGRGADTTAVRRDRAEPRGPGALPGRPAGTGESRRAEPGRRLPGRPARPPADTTG